MTNKVDPANSWSWGQITILALLVLLLLVRFPVNYIVNLHQREREQWPEVRDVPTQTRIVEIPPSRSFIQRLYVGQCLVQYTVAGKSYSTWAPSGYMDVDRKLVQDGLFGCPINLYIIHYNPDHPNESFAVLP
jgi:hypothetical protein